jgi:hypothetical protein
MGNMNVMEDPGAVGQIVVGSAVEARVLPLLDVQMECAGNFGKPADAILVVVIKSAISSMNVPPGMSVTLASLVPATVVGKNLNLSRGNLQILNLNSNNNSITIMSRRVRNPSAQNVVGPTPMTNVYFRVNVRIAKRWVIILIIVAENRKINPRVLARSPEEIYLFLLRNQNVWQLLMMRAPWNRDSRRMRRGTKVLGSSHSFSLFWCIF